MKKTLKLLITTIAIMAIPSLALAVPVSVPSAPGSGYCLVSTTTGNYVASTTVCGGGSGTNYFTNTGGATTSLTTGSILSASTGNFGVINASSTATSSIFSLVTTNTNLIFFPNMLLGKTLFGTGATGGTFITITPSSLSMSGSAEYNVPNNRYIYMNPLNGAQGIYQVGQGGLATFADALQFGDQNSLVDSQISINGGASSTFFNLQGGNVGIATSTPATKLSVVGTTTSSGYVDSSLSNAYLAVDPLGNIIATTTPTGGSGSSTIFFVGNGLSLSTTSTSTTYALITPVSVSNGGTGKTSLTSGGVLIGNGSSPVQVTAAPSDGQSLQFYSINGIPTWGATNLASSGVSVTGTLGFSNGGTGTTSCPANDVFLSNGTIANCVATSSLGFTGTNYFSNSGATTTLTTGSILQAATGTFGVIVASSTTGTSSIANALAIGTTTSFNLLPTGAAGVNNLSVQGSSSFDGNIYLDSSNFGNGALNRQINWGNSYGAEALVLYDNGPADRYGWGLQAGNMQFFLQTGGVYTFNKGGDLQVTGSNELMRIDSNTGNVGIGTTSPVSTLSVVGSSTITATSTVGGIRMTNLKSTVLAVDPNGNVIATTTPGGTNYFTNSGSNTYLNTGTNLQALTLNATSTSSSSISQIPGYTLFGTSTDASTTVQVVGNYSSFAVPATPGSRNNFTGVVGFSFTVAKPIQVNQLGRLYVAGNTQNHNVALWVSTNQTTALASTTVLVSSPSDINGMKWGNIATTTLRPGNTYQLAVDETGGGDTWTDNWTPYLQPYIYDLGGSYNSAYGTYPINNFGNALDTPALGIVSAGTNINGEGLTTGYVGTNSMYDTSSTAPIAMFPNQIIFSNPIETPTIMLDSNNGRIGIGSSTPPTDALDVFGAGKFDPPGTATTTEQYWTNGSGVGWAVCLGSDAIPQIYIGGLSCTASQAFWEANWNTAGAAADTFRVPSGATYVPSVNIPGVAGQTADILDLSSSTGPMGSLVAFTSQGREGIGSTTPGALLAVQGSSTNSTVPLLAISSSTGASIMAALPNGNVGIGTNNPLKPLHVLASTTNGIALFERSTSTSTGGFTTFIMQADASGTPTNTFGPSFDFYTNNATGSLGNKIGFVQAVTDNNSSTTGDLQLITMNAGTQNNALTVLYNGNVGVGSTSPGAILTVQATSSNSTTPAFVVNSNTGSSSLVVQSSGGVCVGVSSCGTGEIVVAGVPTPETVVGPGTLTNSNAINNVRATGSGNASFQFTTDSVADRNVIGYNGSTGDFEFDTGGVIGSNIRMVISDNTGTVGNVGFGGTTTPAYNLSASGTVGFSGLTTGGGDCVTINTGSKQINDAGSATCSTSSLWTKHDISSIPDSEIIAIVNAVSPVMFTYNDDDTKHFGFIAEQVDALASSTGISDIRRLVYYANQDTPETQPDGSIHVIKKGQPYAIDYNGFVALDTRYIQIMDKNNKSAPAPNPTADWAEWLAISLLGVGFTYQLIKKK